MSERDIYIKCNYFSRTIPKYGTREVLMLISALSTCDPGPVTGTLGALNDANISGPFRLISSFIDIIIF